MWWSRPTLGPRFGTGAILDGAKIKSTLFQQGEQYLERFNAGLRIIMIIIRWRPKGA